MNAASALVPYLVAMSRALASLPGVILPDSLPAAMSESTLPDRCVASSFASLLLIFGAIDAFVARASRAPIASRALLLPVSFMAIAASASLSSEAADSLSDMLPDSLSLELDDSDDDSDDIEDDSLSDSCVVVTVFLSLVTFASSLLSAASAM